MRTVFRSFFGGVKVSQVVQFMTMSDFMMMSGWGLISPVIAVFFSDQVEGGSVALAGLAATVYFLVKSLVQIPVARFIDRQRGEWDDWWVMVTGSLIISLSAFLYVFVSLPWHVIAVQILYGFGGALSFPSWLAIFTRHLDKREEGFEWSLYYTSVDIGSALTAGFGGLLIAAFGYKPVFALVGIASLIGTAFLAGVTRNLLKRT